MKAIFLDTSFLIAVIRAKDQYHAAALKWKAELRGRFVTTEYVLIEFLDASSPRSLRRRGLNALRIDVPRKRALPLLSGSFSQFGEQHGDNGAAAIGGR